MGPSATRLTGRGAGQGLLGLAIFAFFAPLPPVFGRKGLGDGGKNHPLEKVSPSPASGRGPGGGALRPPLGTHAAWVRDLWPPFVIETAGDGASRKKPGNGGNPGPPFPSP